MAVGETNLSTVLFLALAIAAIFCDLLWRRIFNWINLSGFVVGLALSFYEGGIFGGLNSLGASVLALLIFGFIYKSGHLGGGDVKLLVALGAWCGVKPFLELAVLSIVFGGIFALLVLILQKRLSLTLFKLRAWILPAIRTRFKLDHEVLDKSNSIPFGIPVSIAGLILFFNHGSILVRMGVDLW